MERISALFALALALFSFNANAYTVHFKDLDGFSKLDEKKLEQAGHLIEKIFESDAFKQRVTEFAYAGKAEFVQNDGLSNAQVLEKILSRPMELELTLYRAPWWKRIIGRDSTIGHTNPGTSRIWVNVKFFRSFTVADVASNLAHEWMHKLGFDHDYNYTARRPYSVPYAVGDMVGDLGSQKSN